MTTETRTIDTDMQGITLGIPNNQSPQITSATVLPALRNLLSLVQRKRPLWTYVGNHYQHTANIELCVVTGVRIYAKHRTLVGVVHVREGSDNTYVLSNDRIARALERKKTRETKNINTAASLMLKLFTEKTPEERIVTAKEELKGLRRSVLVGRNDVTTSYSRLTGALVPYVLANWDVVRAAAVGVAPGQATQIDAFPKAWADLQVLESMEKRTAQSGSTIVVVNGRDYILHPTSNETTYVVDTDTVPPGIKQQIGMLKLVEVGSVVGGVGYRISENEFFCAGEEP